MGIPSIILSFIITYSFRQISTYVHICAYTLNIIPQIKAYRHQKLEPILF